MSYGATRTLPSFILTVCNLEQVTSICKVASKLKVLNFQPLAPYSQEHAEGRASGTGFTSTYLWESMTLTYAGRLDSVMFKYMYVLKLSVLNWIIVLRRKTEVDTKEARMRVSALLSRSNGISHLSVSKMRHIILTLICGVIFSWNLTVYSIHIDLKISELFVLVRIMVQWNL